MATLSSFMQAIEDRIAGAPALVAAAVAILHEDPEELEADIAKIMGSLGLLILIGQPFFNNKTPESRAANMKITTKLAVGENPKLWRGKADLIIAPDSPNYDGAGNLTFNGLVQGRSYTWTPGEVGTVLEGGESLEPTPTLTEAGIFTTTTNNAYVHGGPPNEPFTGSLVLPGAGADKPICIDVAQIVVERLQGFRITGFEPLRVISGDPVPDKQRQLFEIEVESQFIVQKAN